jgi:hypothetical protein
VYNNYVFRKVCCVGWRLRCSSNGFVVDDYVERLVTLRVVVVVVVVVVDVYVIVDNHIKSAGNITNAVKQAKRMNCCVKTLLCLQKSIFDICSFGRVCDEG